MFRSSSILLALLPFACAGSPNEAPAPAPTASAAPAEMAPETVLATWQGGQLSWGDVQGDLESQLRAMEVEYLMKKYETTSQTLDAKVNEKLLEAEVAKRGLADIDALLVAEIEEKVTPPSEEEVAMFYMSVKRQIGGATLEEAKPMLEQELIRRAQMERFRAYIEELRTAAGVEVTLPYPDLPRIDVAITSHDPVAGAADAPVTIVQFAEYQCPYCKTVSPTLDRLLENYDGKVRVVFKDYPLPSHSRAMPAAVAAHCAGDQGKYWEMNETLLANQGALGDADLTRYAGEIGLDGASFAACMTSGKHEVAIAEDVSVGQKAGVEATPTLFVNGILVAGALPYDHFERLVEQELGKTH
jgi:protein-disulfide isomerase